MRDLQKATEATQQLLSAIGVDEGDHTTDTPTRVAKAWADILSGYNQDPRQHLKKTFTAPANPGLIIVGNIRIQSTCAHHLLPITGHATIAYRPHPGQKVVGLSKLERLADGYARRLQVQERITNQIVEAIDSELQPQWVACAITADHGCMTLRGIRDTCSNTTTLNTIGTPNPGDMELFTTTHHQHR